MASPNSKMVSYTDGQALSCHAYSHAGIIAHTEMPDTGVAFMIVSIRTLKAHSNLEAHLWTFISCSCARILASMQSSSENKYQLKLLLCRPCTATHWAHAGL